MAPTTKRARPAFSPPRPGKSKSTSAVGKRASTGSTGNTTATARVETGSRAKTSKASKASVRSETETRTKAKAKAKAKTSAGKQPQRQQQKRSRYASETSSESDSQAADSDESGTERPENDEEMEDEDEVGDQQEEDSHMTIDSPPSSLASPSSPEPEYILAEVTTTASNTKDTTDTSTPRIAPGLIHRIIHTHFATPDKTKLTKDAKDLVAKYIEVFVREAIMRCAYEKQGTSNSVDDGWLEVEDLEKVAVQLCLDF